MTNLNSRTITVYATYLFLLHVEIFDDDTDEEVESEEGAKDDEQNEVEVHQDAVLKRRLTTDLHTRVKHTTSRQKDSTHL